MIRIYRSTQNHSHSNAGVISGSVVAGVVVVALITSFLWWWLRHRRSESLPPVTPFVSQRQSGQGTIALLGAQDRLHRKGERTFLRKGENPASESIPDHAHNPATDGSGINTGGSLPAGIRHDESSSQISSIPITANTLLPQGQSTNIERILQAIADGIAATRVPGHEIQDPSIPPPEYAWDCHRLLISYILGHVEWLVCLWKNTPTRTWNRRRWITIVKCWKLVQEQYTNKHPERWIQEDCPNESSGISKECK